MADKIVVMRDGVVEQIGAPLDLYDNPANQFVASFIGSPAMNFLNGEITAAGFNLGQGIVLPLQDQSLPPGPAIYGVRPEHLRLDPGGVEMEVVVVEPTGAETFVVARLAGQDVNCLLRERHAIGPGDRLTVLPDPSVQHLFHANSGERLN